MSQARRAARRSGSFTSPLTRFRRCNSLRILYEGSDGDDDIQHPSLLAAWCVAGMGADAARSISVLSLEGALDLPTLVAASLVLAGTLQHVHTLKLNTRPCGAGGFHNLDAVHSALRGAFPALQELCLPAKACLRGLEAFAGSALHTVRVMANSPGRLRRAHVRSVLRLSQLRHLDLRGAGWDAEWGDEPDPDDDDDGIWEDLDAEADGDGGEDGDEDGPAAVEELARWDATLVDSARELREQDVQELLVQQWLLFSAPPALESLQLTWLLQMVNFEGGRITSALMEFGYRQDLLRFAAATLLPRLEATGQRLPLLEVRGRWVAVARRALAAAAFTRLLAKCDRVELGLLKLLVGSVSHAGTEAAAALQAVARAMVGGLPEQLEVSGPKWDCMLCTLQVRPRCRHALAAAGGGRGGEGEGRGGGGAATAAQPAAVMALTTAEQVLGGGGGQDLGVGVGAGRGVDGGGSGGSLCCSRGGGGLAGATVPLFSQLEQLGVLLRGPFVSQLARGPGADGGGGGSARLLTDWLCSLVAAGPLPPAAAVQGSEWDAAAGAAAEVGMRGCSFAPCGSGDAMAVVACGCPFAALQLHRAAAAAAREAPGCLQVSAARAAWDKGKATDCWHSAIGEQPAAATAVAAAGTAGGTAGGPAAGADGPAAGGGGGGPAQTIVFGAGGAPGRALGGEAGDAAPGDGGAGSGGGGGGAAAAAAAGAAPPPMPPAPLLYPFPEQPPPDLAVALAAGLLPAVEAALRRTAAAKHEGGGGPDVVGLTGGYMATTRGGGVLPAALERTSASAAAEMAARCLRLDLVAGLLGAGTGLFEDTSGDPPPPSGCSSGSPGSGSGGGGSSSSAAAGAAAAGGSRSIGREREASAQDRQRQQQQRAGEADAASVGTAAEPPPPPPLLWAAQPGALRQQLLLLLAFAPPRQAAALVATLGKLLTRTNQHGLHRAASAAPALSASRSLAPRLLKGEAMSEVAVAVELLSSCCQSWPAMVTHLVRHHTGFGGGGGGGGGSRGGGDSGGGGGPPMTPLMAAMEAVRHAPPPLQQLRRLVSFAAHRWLPPLMLALANTRDSPAGSLGAAAARRACLGALAAVHPLLCSCARGARAVGSMQRRFVEETSWRQLMGPGARLAALLAAAVGLMLQQPAAAAAADGRRRSSAATAGGGDAVPAGDAAQQRLTQQLHTELCRGFLAVAPLAIALEPGEVTGALAGGDEAEAILAEEEAAEAARRRGGGRGGGGCGRGVPPTDAAWNAKLRQLVALGRGRLARFFELPVLRGSVPEAPEIYDTVRAALEAMRSEYAPGVTNTSLRNGGGSDPDGLCRACLGVWGIERLLAFGATTAAAAAAGHKASQQQLPALLACDNPAALHPPGGRERGRAGGGAAGVRRLQRVGGITASSGQ
ncbi:hypothetical protein HXX76_015208 [Chlamydomonas incerta]|uniref:Uncharacterized protein n=1 Tax=Chlamydomonas incerta TaxID=51695 RepID=A0A835VRW0_CHLIN|nr:hypothetical protein HXX76_015208 [Chlamydomonas incerta]|eukprot:KAG2423568.1 hypothetical protein HXX76_015208 [Chlamydomonas incerta]